MKRLTEKDENGKYYIVEEKICIGTEQINPIKTWITGNENRGYGKPIDKLGRLEDLEEELGCHLDVLGKVILQNCFYDIYGNIIETDIGYINQEGTTGIVMSVEEWEMGNTILLSDHKKTWWIKEDKSE